MMDSGLKGEIQTITSNPSYSRVAAIDARGSVSVFSNNENDIVQLYNIAPTSQSVESGWSGVSIHPTLDTQLSTTRFFQKQVHNYDADRLVSTYQLANHPTQIAYFTPSGSTSSLLAVTEQNQLNIYDSRLPNALIHKFTPSSSVLYAIGTSDHYVGVGGEGRSLHVYDTRKWSNVGNWSNCLKYEITSINFSGVDKAVSYLGGLDSEILAGAWNGSGGVDHFSGLRVDSRWLGVSKLRGSETLFGLTSLGSVYWRYYNWSTFKESKE
eukprot:gene19072-22837_t